MPIRNRQGARLPITDFTARDIVVVAVPIGDELSYG
jgi:hypothetical protein